MKKQIFFRGFWPAFAVIMLFAAFTLQNKPTVYIIGDSTVQNTGKGQAGWGTYLIDFLDSNKVNVSNQAAAGRSTRTFIKEGRWDKVLSTLKPGDYVFMQFGHNEGAKPSTTDRFGARGVLRGTGNDTLELIWPSGEKEVVYTYGHYLRRFIREAKAKGATPVVLSMIPRNQWVNGKVKRADNDYGKWAKEAAELDGALFVDLNKITADKYDIMGPEKVKELFPGDHTHTNQAGARINAASVAEGLRLQKQLTKYLR
ncbi:rhamnogalacturonan acetylesterase [Paradesertivirga mongoliensis]|uniref:Rhamnogalacturonan acetylesterase n=1 Tax=Paradesertivirga mongoliensis TaxID=2100740 RepID=A0ABW4ZJB8_9SPHI|nr:rhamnogalacturonan acetylesterase [Pedobacter mongoliensis]